MERENLVTFNVSNCIIELEEGGDSYCSIEPGEGNKFNSILEPVVEEDCNNIIDLGEGNDSSYSMEPWEEYDSSNTMEIGNENISNSNIEPGEGSSSENSSMADLDISKIKGLKIASLNVNSLMKHIDEIRVMLINYPLDILTISETKIDSTISDIF